MSDEPYEFVDYHELVKLAIRDVKTASVDVSAERRAAVEELLKRAEDMLAIARAKGAKDLGFRIHDCKYPPPLMLWDQSRQAHVCEHCGHVRQSASVRVSNNTSWVRSRQRRGGGDGTGWMGN
jgi:hypothetical protein